MKKAKNTNKKNMYKSIKWYLIYDGKDHKVTSDLTDYENIHCIVIEISSQQAAAYLLMKQTYTED